MNTKKVYPLIIIVLLPSRPVLSELPMSDYRITRGYVCTRVVRKFLGEKAGVEIYRTGFLPVR
jgi:hypothetical protein